MNQHTRSVCVSCLCHFGACVLLCAVIAGCNRSTAKTTPTIELSATQGELSIHALLNRDEVDTSGQLTLTVRTVCPVGAVIAAPNVADVIEPLRITSHTVGEPRLLHTDTIERTWTYVLSPFLPGEFAIGPIVVEMSAIANQSPAIAQLAPIDVTVTSVIELEPDQEYSIESLDVTDYIDEPAPNETKHATRITLPMILGAAGLTMCVVGFGFFVLRRSLRSHTAHDDKQQIKSISTHARGLQSKLTPDTATSHADDISHMISSLMLLVPESSAYETMRDRLETAYIQLNDVRFGNASASGDIAKNALNVVIETAHALEHTPIPAPDALGEPQFAVPSLGGRSA